MLGAATEARVNLEERRGSRTHTLMAAAQASLAEARGATTNCVASSW
jgi:hypothetical protein